ncbi:MAG: 1-(5-phosphoribosyl)-5-[(5-phosphoribosylamino)methylideneamino] imidazole-4-carboxamide isomerase [Gemmatimonadaceae bacterium]|nr:1-(5-phosphoribosyl)-5-[(5-phosphoribosylamino)methylideneamino] imidazole-4-carboxamide isomerase [Gemmatimonadaceae bacterium]
MIVMPAVDIRDGACVQLVGGDYAREMIRIDSPVQAALDWQARGFEWLHVVDLDAATRTGNNSATVEEILSTVKAKVSVGGGVKSLEQTERLLEMGASRVVIGSRGIADRKWLRDLAETFPQQIVLAADVRDRVVLTAGWRDQSTIRMDDLVTELNGIPLAAVLVTAVHLEGQQAGTDLQLFGELVSALTVPLIASGGITTMQDLSALSEKNISAAVIGMALYTGALQADIVAKEYGK